MSYTHTVTFCLQWKLCFLLIFFSFEGFSQPTFYLSMPASEQDQAILQQFDIPTIFLEKDSIQPALETLLHEIRQSGYYAATIDSIVDKDSVVIAPIYIGLLYNQFHINNGNLPDKVWQSTTVQPYTNRVISFQELEEFKEALLKYGENNGYPFASVWLADIATEDKSIKGAIYWRKGPAISLGELKMEGDPVVSVTYLQKYLGLQKGALYNKTKIEEAINRLQTLPFLTSTRNPTVLFQENEVNLYFFLQPKKANRFDFLIGVLPNNQETNSVLVTTDIDAVFYNQFRKGEKIGIRFERLRPETQELNLVFSYPYILNTSLGIDAAFELYRRDSTYRDLNWNFGIQYQFTSHHYLKAFTQSLSTTLLDVDATQIIRENSLPANLDTRYNGFGLAYYYEQLDYRFNPRQGWTFSFNGSAGFKSINENEAITDAINEDNLPGDLETAYEDLQSNSFQYRLEGQFTTFIPFRQRNTFYISLRGATILSEQTIFNNEHFRIGGAKSLRGFDEQSIFASNYILWTGEYRYLIGQRSYLNVFTDFAWVRREAPNEFTDMPLGIGAGMVFETKAGIFEIAYALGKLQGTPFDFRQAKIHFGFVYDF